MSNALKDLQALPLYAQQDYVRQIDESGENVPNAYKAAFAAIRNTYAQTAPTGTASTEQTNQVQVQAQVGPTKQDEKAVKPTKPSLYDEGPMLTDWPKVYRQRVSGGCLQTLIFGLIGTIVIIGFFVALSLQTGVWGK